MSELIGYLVVFGWLAMYLGGPVITAISRMQQRARHDLTKYQSTEESDDEG